VGPLERVEEIGNTPFQKYGVLNVEGDTEWEGSSV